MASHFIVGIHSYESILRGIVLEWLEEAVRARASLVEEFDAALRAEWTAQWCETRHATKQLLYGPPRSMHMREAAFRRFNNPLQVTVPLGAHGRLLDSLRSRINHERVDELHSVHDRHHAELQRLSCLMLKLKTALLKKVPGGSNRISRFCPCPECGRQRRRFFLGLPLASDPPNKRKRENDRETQLLIEADNESELS